MTKSKVPLKRNILAGTVVFILLLCAVLSVVHLQSHRQMLYSQYEKRIGDILQYIEAEIDVDDLAECMRTGVASEKYHALQSLLDGFKERLDIHYIYVVEPLNAEPTDNLRNVIAGATQYEYENEADELVYLNMPTGDSYSPQTAARYLEAYRSDRLTFFEEISEWGGRLHRPAAPARRPGQPGGRAVRGRGRRPDPYGAPAQPHRGCRADRAAGLWLYHELHHLDGAERHPAH